MCTQLKEVHLVCHVGIVVSALACQESSPGSIPQQRQNYFFPHPFGSDNFQSCLEGCAMSKGTDDPTLYAMILYIGTEKVKDSYSILP